MLMIKIKLYDQHGMVTIKLSKGKRYTICKENIKTWDKVEVTEV